MIVAVDHGDKTTIHYRFKDAVGDDLDKTTGVEMMRCVQEAAAKAGEYATPRLAAALSG